MTRGKADRLAPAFPQPKFGWYLRCGRGVLAIESSSNEHVADRMKDEEKIPWSPYLTQQGYRGKCLHLLLGDIVSLAKGFVSAKGVPRRRAMGFLITRNEAFGFRIGQKEELPCLQTEHFRKPCNDLFGWMALSSFKMADVRNRSSDPTCKLFLGQIKFPSACTNGSAKLLKVGMFHRFIPHNMA